MLKRITDDFAAAVMGVDAQRPIANNKRSGTAFSAGIGPHSEAETLALTLAETRRASPDFYLEVRTGVPYPRAPRQRCDLEIVTKEGRAFIEGKLLRLKGDNGKPNDNLLMHILSPYPQHRSALTDCAKLSASGFGGLKAVLVVGYTYPDLPLEPALLAFEKLASEVIGARHEARFTGLCHPVHREGSIVAWMVK